MKIADLIFVSCVATSQFTSLCNIKNYNEEIMAFDFSIIPPVKYGLVEKEFTIGYASNV